MMPWAKLNTAPVTSSPPPHMRAVRRPHEIRRAREVGARARPGEPEAGGQQEQGGRDQPRDLAAELGQEEPVPAGDAPARPDGAQAADAAGLIAGDAAEAVVAEDQVEQAVVL